MSNKIKIIENESDFLLKIEEDLKFDSLYQLIVERDQLKKELFSRSFLSILEKDIHRWYSVAEAGKVLGGDKPIPPSSLTYYIDSLREYIIPEDAPSNKYIRLNYLSLLKMKMVLLLKDEFRLNGLRAELGLVGNPKQVVSRNNSNIPSTEVNGSLEERLEKLEMMNEFLFNLLIEKGEGDQLQLKGALESLLNSETKLLEDQSSLFQKLEDQEETIEQLIESDRKLTEIIENTEKKTNSIVEKIEVSEKDREKIQESEKQLTLLKETLKARQQAEMEFESKGFLKRLKINRSEFIDARVRELLTEWIK
ncbi:hypothetical protein WMO40_20960 [Bacillaceae bacterium CLA-AA-H227]|uniref:Uncharacterized protein n=1 Tax=Robertmurraya yapensis (ex Hitch et al 2024) TaxID=3133160 RepID=A0ACC6SJF1_9BACI